jgi:hypothetical protein
VKKKSTIYPKRKREVQRAGEKAVKFFEEVIHVRDDDASAEETDTADKAAEVGALAYYGPGGEDYGPGAWVTFSNELQAPHLRLYRDMDTESTFPPDSHIALSTLARAVEDFRATGGLRPSGCMWRPSTVW